MRSRPLAAASAAFALALFTASCGGDGEDPIVAPSQAGQVTPTSPFEATATPESTPEAPGGGKGGDKTDTPRKGPDQSKETADLLPAVAADNSDLTNFSTALGAASLTSTLGQNGPYTVFAPNNDGFAKLGTRLDSLLQPASKAELVNILSFHVVSGEVRLKDLEDGTLLTTLQGTRLRVGKKGDTITLGNSLGEARLVSSNLDAGNGVIHVIDTVLSPKTK